MEVLRITSDLRRVQFLKDASRRVRKCLEDGTELPFSFMIERLFELETEFRKKTKAWKKSHQAWQNRSAGRLELNEYLSRCVRDFSNVLIRRTARRGHKPDVLSYFKAPTEGNFPHVTQISAWEELAISLIDGDAEAVAAGYPAMQNPDVAELQEHLSKVEAADTEVKAAVAAKSDAQQDLQKLRLEVDEFIRKLYHFLTGWLTDMNPGTRREAMRNFGYVFKSTGQENIGEPPPRNQDSNETPQDGEAPPKGQEGQPGKEEPDKLSDHIKKEEVEQNSGHFIPERKAS